MTAFEAIKSRAANVIQVDDVADAIEAAIEAARDVDRPTVAICGRDHDNTVDKIAWALRAKGIVFSLIRGVNVFDISNLGKIYVVNETMRPDRAAGLHFDVVIEITA